MRDRMVRKRNIRHLQLTAIRDDVQHHSARGTAAPNSGRAVGVAARGGGLPDSVSRACFACRCNG